MIGERKEGFSTTFWQDFSIADAFGIAAVMDTFNRAFGEWKDDYLYVTDLVLALNHKIWQHYQRGNVRYAKLYDELRRKADQYAVEHLQGDELSYYYKVLD